MGKRSESVIESEPEVGWNNKVTRLPARTICRTGSITIATIRKQEKDVSLIWVVKQDVLEVREFTQE